LAVASHEGRALPELLQLERWLGNLFEASFRGRPGELDWMEVARQLMAAAIESEVRRGDRLLIPHRYCIRLNPSDWDVVSSHIETLQNELRHLPQWEPVDGAPGGEIRRRYSDRTSQIPHEVVAAMLCGRPRTSTS
jgi:hypothetical protein